MATILIVDDSDYQRSNVASRLEKAGHVIFQAENGRKALDLIGRQKFDCIFTDIHMPEMDGLTMLKALQDRGNKVPIVVLTADAKPETLEIIRDLGARGFLGKPVSDKGLLAVVEGVLKLKAAGNHP